eukprot:202065_1
MGNRSAYVSEPEQYKYKVPDLWKTEPRIRYSVRFPLSTHNIGMSQDRQSNALQYHGRRELHKRINKIKVMEHEWPQETKLTIAYLHQFDSHYEITTNDMYEYLLKNNIPQNDASGFINIATNIFFVCRSARQWWSATRCFDLTDCDHLNQLERCMLIYDEYGRVLDFNIYDALNSFLHVMTEHNDAFETIYYRLGGFCNINTCNRFYRHGGLRYNINLENELISGYLRNDYKDVIPIDIICLVQQYYAVKHPRILIDIMDKIHCHYRHGYDLGYRSKRFSSNVDVNNKPLMSKQITSSDRFSRFNCLNIGIQSEIKQNNELQEYSFGHLFEYPYNPDHVEKYKAMKYIMEWVNNHYIVAYFQETNTTNVTDLDYGDTDKLYIGEIKYKFKDLKEELTSNGISELTIDQFTHELEKATIYYNTDYCAKIVDKYVDDNFDDSIFDGNSDRFYRRRYLSVVDILSIMVYCNYSNLSYEFSKTYRKIKPNETKEEIGVRHSNFYWLAKFVYETVNWFGSSERVPSLYHGIGNECILPTISESFRGVKIYGPLSTSSSIAVAANFAKYNSGLIIMFDDHDYANGSRCFSCNWLSDYSHEQEYLFLQNRYGYFKITNIIHAASGIEFAIIINALRILLTLINGAAHGLSPWNHILRKISKRSVDDMNENDRSELNDTFGIKCEHDKIIMCQLIEKMIQHQLVMVNRDKYIQCKYVQFVDLHHYGGTLLNAFCSNQTDISLDQDLFEKSGFSNLIIYFWLDYEVNSKLLKDLFPNCKTFAVCNSLKNYNNE